MPRMVPTVDCEHCRCVDEGRTRENVRCCDVTPQFPNFLVGELLQSQEHEVISSWITQRRGDPYSLFVPPVVAKAHLDARVDGLYGMACPLLHVETGRCSVYAFRPGLCVGYHCYYPDVMWVEMWSCLTSLLCAAEDAASRYLVQRAGFSFRRMSAIWEHFEDELAIWDGVGQRAEVYNELWQDWLGREEAFYKLCFARLHEEGEEAWEQIVALQEEHLFARRDHGVLGLEGAMSAGIMPIKPTTSLRMIYRKGRIRPEENVLSLPVQERLLMWYMEQLEQKGRWGRWTRFFREISWGGKLGE